MNTRSEILLEYEPCKGRRLLLKVWLWIARHERGWRFVVLIAAIAATLIQGMRVIFWPNDDFDLHWEFGRRFLKGDLLYAGGLDVPYPPFWAMLWAPVSIIPIAWARALAYPLGIGALILLLKVLKNLADHFAPLDEYKLFWANAATLLLASRFILRDMTECNLNTALVLLAWLSLYGWLQKRDFWGGTCLGLAIALKCTPGLFLLYFALKRQWKVFTISAAVTIVLSLAPALWLGMDFYVQHMSIWMDSVGHSLSDADPAVGTLGPEPAQNASLRAALARFLIRLSAQHPARVDHRWYLEFLDLSGPIATWVIRAIIASLVVGVGWLFCKPIQGQGGEKMLWEYAAISLLILLISPITWKQHCVAAIPALYLLMRKVLACGVMGLGTGIALSAYAFFTLILNREFVGREISILLDSYRLTTWCLCLLLAVTLAYWKKT